MFWSLRTLTNRVPQLLLSRILCGLLIALIVSSSVTTSLEARERYDILGVSLGMTPADATRIISAEQPAWTIQNSKGPDANIDSIIATRPAAAPKVSEILAISFNGTDEKAWYVGRRVMFINDKPLANNLQSDLQAKYGPISAKWPLPPADKDYAFPALIWAFASNENQIFGHDVTDHNGCLDPTAANGGQSIGSDVPIADRRMIDGGFEGQTNPLTLPIQVNDACGVSVIIQLALRPANLDIVDGLTEAMYDQHARFVDLKNIHDQEQKGEQQKKEKARQNASQQHAPL